MVDDITRYDFRVRDGEDIELAITVLNPDGSAKDLTDASAEYKALDESGATAIDKSSAGGGIAFAGNVVEVTIDGADWTGLAGECLSYHVRLTDGNARTQDLLQGVNDVVASPFT